MKQPLLSSVWSVMLDGKSSSCKIKALEGSKPTGAIIFEFIKLYSYGLNNFFAFITNQESHILVWNYNSFSYKKKSSFFNYTSL